MPIFSTEAIRNPGFEMVNLTEGSIGCGNEQGDLRKATHLWDPFRRKTQHSAAYGVEDRQQPLGRRRAV
jgi:hypothetical protein